MAEGGNLQSIKDVSDADFEFSCTPCGDDHIRKEAVKYCPECQEYLCTSCSRQHGRRNATKTHTLLDKDDAKQKPFITETKCLYHPDRDIEMYCETHDMVYCTLCIATEHRSCYGINKIEDESIICVSQTEIQHILEGTKKAHTIMKALEVKQEKNIASLTEQRSVVQEKLEETEARLIEHIRKLKRDTSDTVDNVYAKTKEELLQSEMSVSMNTIQNLEKTLEQLQLIGNMDARHQFVRMKLTKKIITEAQKLHGNSESDDTKLVNFTENKELVPSVMTAVSLGQVRAESKGSKSSKPKQYKMKSKTEVHISEVNDRSVCSISDICQFHDGTFILADFDNSKIKRLAINYKIKDYCDLEAKPTGICCPNMNEVAVKMTNNKIQFISVSSALSKTRCIGYIASGGQFGLTCCDDELWTSQSGNVNVYNLQGTFQKCFDKDQNGKAIFTSGIQHMTVSGDTVIVTDSKGAVYLNKDGTLVRELRDDRLQYARGVCVSDDGAIFLSGFNSNNIVMFSKDGKCLGELVATDAGLTSPINMCFDNNKHCITVTCMNSNTIHFVELCE